MDPFAPPRRPQPRPRSWAKPVIAAALVLQGCAIAAHAANVGLSWPNVPPFTAGLLLGVLWGLAIAASITGLFRD